MVILQLLCSLLSLTLVPNHCQLSLPQSLRKWHVWIYHRDIWYTLDLYDQTYTNASLISRLQCKPAGLGDLPAVGSVGTSDISPPLEPDPSSLSTDESSMCISNPYTEVTTSVSGMLWLLFLNESAIHGWENVRCRKSPKMQYSKHFQR